MGSEDGITVLSLFDGMSCGQIALNRLGVKIARYYASEIDKYAIAVTQHNYPDTIQLGDITKWQEWDIDWGEIDLVIGGSPCQGLSASGKGEGLDDYRSKLFFDYIDIRDYVVANNPKAIFLLENVIPRKKEWADNMTANVGVSPVMIDSSLLSAQSRKRLYWINVKGIEQPNDNLVTLSSIIDDDAYMDKSYWLSKESHEYMMRKVKGGRNHFDFCHHSSTDNAKSATVVANFRRGVPYNVLIDLSNAICNRWNCDFQYEDHDFCLNSCGGTVYYKNTGEPTPAFRRFTPTECERLQTVPDGYTSLGDFDGREKEMSKTQRYKMLGNGWTVDVVAHILSFIPEVKSGEWLK
jgi:site-specific DNA-cytosine methylase